MTATAIPTAHRRNRIAPGARPGLTRTIRVEFRKLVDSRAAIITALIGLSLTATFAAGSFFVKDHLKLDYFLTVTGVPASLIILTMGVMAITSEYSTRAAMPTHLLEPNRARVLLAKAAALVAMTFLVNIVVKGLGVPAYLAGVAIRGAEPVWDVDWFGQLAASAAQSVYVLEAFALGMVLLNGPAAIVIVLSETSLFSVLRTAMPERAEQLAYLDPGSLANLVENATYTAAEWTQVGVGLLIWLVLPAIVGTVRILRKEVA